MHNARMLLLIAWGMAMACEAGADGDGATFASHVASVGCKPQAPVTVDMRSRALGGGRYEITVEASPWADVASVEIGLRSPDGARVAAGQRAVFGRTAAGATRAHVAVVEIQGPGARVLADVRVGLDPAVRPVKVAELAVGAVPAPAPERTRVIALPTGERVEEVVR